MRFTVGLLSTIDLSVGVPKMSVPVTFSFVLEGHQWSSQCAWVSTPPSRHTHNSRANSGSDLGHLLLLTNSCTYVISVKLCQVLKYLNTFAYACSSYNLCTHYTQIHSYSTHMHNHSPKTHSYFHPLYACIPTP